MFCFTRYLAPYLLLCSLSACSDRSTHEDKSPSAIERWAAGNGKRLSTSLLRLRDGSCIDTSRMNLPWHVDPKASAYSNGLGVWANGKALGIVPIEHDLILGPMNGRLLVSINGWSPPKHNVISWELASPERIKSNIRSGLFSPIDLWPKSSYGLKAYRYGANEMAYLDERHLTQCRDYGASDQIWCSVVSKDQHWGFYVHMDGSNRARVPGKLRLIEASVERIRGICPSG